MGSWCTCGGIGQNALDGWCIGGGGWSKCGWMVPCGGGACAYIGGYRYCGSQSGGGIDGNPDDDDDGVPIGTPCGSNEIKMKHNGINRTRTLRLSSGVVIWAHSPHSLPGGSMHDNAFNGVYDLGGSCGVGLTSRSSVTLDWTRYCILQ